jgi:phosphotransferase system HPr (HPr) family protein
MLKIKLNVTSDVGLHARPASEFVKTASNFKAKISVRNVTKSSNAVAAKSILSVLSLGVEKDHEIELTAEGEDEILAIQSLRKLIEPDILGKF